MAHGDVREEKWRGKRRMVWVVSSFQSDSEQSVQCYYNRSPPTLTPRKPVLDWTDTPADINGLVRFPGSPNLVSARVPSRPVFTLLQSFSPDPHSKKASTRLNWHPRRDKWTRPFRWKTESGFCACAITFRLHSTWFLGLCRSQLTLSQQCQNRYSVYSTLAFYS